MSRRVGLAKELMRAEEEILRAEKKLAFFAAKLIGARARRRRLLRRLERAEADLSGSLELCSACGLCEDVHRDAGCKWGLDPGDAPAKTPEVKA